MREQSSCPLARDSQLPSRPPPPPSPALPLSPSQNSPLATAALPPHAVLLSNPSCLGLCKRSVSVRDPYPLTSPRPQPPHASPCLVLSPPWVEKGGQGGTATQFMLCEGVGCAVKRECSHRQSASDVRLRTWEFTRSPSFEALSAYQGLGLE